MYSIRDFFSRKRAQKALRDEDEKALFTEKYGAFRRLLEANNQVLLLMGDMQEKGTGAYLFDRAYVRSSYDALSKGVEGLIQSLNDLCDGRYGDLEERFREMDARIRPSLTDKVAIPETEDVLRLREVKKEMVAAVGGKMAHLGELHNVLDLPVPPGFVITTRAYERFARHNHITSFLKEMAPRFQSREFQEVVSLSETVQDRVRNGEVPPELEKAIGSGYRGLCEDLGQEGLRMAVRSSGVQEDVLASFAGQYKTVLHVSSEELVSAYKEVLASQFTPRALFYYRDRGFAVEDMAMAVGVLVMVEARASGVIYSRDPEQPGDDAVLISAVWGLGPYAVEGKVPATQFRVSGGDIQEMSGGDTARQDRMLAGDHICGLREVPVPEEWRARPCLTAEELHRLAAYARVAESRFEGPQDMEWAVDRNDRIYLLQSRPLRLSTFKGKASTRPRVVEGHKILLNQGTVACSGVASGTVVVVHGEEELAGFPEGGILVVRHTHPEYASVMSKAAALISDIGTALGHLATVAREYNRPAILNTQHATTILKTGMQVTVDAVYANIYEGIVDEVLKDTWATSPPPTSPQLRQLRQVLKEIAPLNLTDPRSPDFRPKNCKTFHDITRFAHEISMRALLDLSKESHFAERSARQLVSGVPLQWWVVDLEDGLVKGVKGRKVTPEEIASIPMQALWKGMTAAPWKGPPPINTRGFMSVMLSASMDAGIEPAVQKTFADKNYILVARNFCNVSTRLGFHFSTIEAYVGDQENQNYVSFVYTGGGADDGRKGRRADLISRILENFDFRVDKRGDTLFARIEGYKRAFLEQRLQVLGHLIVHTRQMDMVMYNDTMVDWYYKDLMKGIEKHILPGPSEPPPEHGN